MAYDERSMNMESVAFRFEPARASRFWQHNATRLIRANERILHGLMAAATREVELAQELARFNVEKFYKIPNGAGAEKATAEAPNAKEFEHIMAGFREVTEELWKTFGDASKLLLEGSLTEAEEPVGRVSESLKT